MLFGAYMDELLYTSLKYNRMQMDLDGNGRSSKTSAEVIALDWIESSTEQLSFKNIQTFRNKFCNISK